GDDEAQEERVEQHLRAAEAHRAEGIATEDREGGGEDDRGYGDERARAEVKREVTIRPGGDEVAPVPVRGWLEGGRVRSGRIDAREENADDRVDGHEREQDQQRVVDRDLRSRRRVHSSSR